MKAGLSCRSRIRDGIGEVGFLKGSSAPTAPYGGKGGKINL